jgi:NADH-quinone oxidoreductase subunit J
MLARQSGSAGYDQRSQNTVVACLAAFLLIGAITKTLQTNKVEFARPVIAAAAADNTPGTPAAVAAEESESGDQEAPATAPAKPKPSPNYLSKADAKTPLGSLRGLGRSLFSDYLFAVELAGTLLLVASIGAIAIAPRREEGAL